VTDRHCRKINLCLERDVAAVTAPINLHGALPIFIKILDCNPCGDVEIVSVI
jgi:hypothetical protein